MDVRSQRAITGRPRAARSWPAGPLAVCAAAGLCFLDPAILRAGGALLLVALLPGWMLWQATDGAWGRRPWELRATLAFVASGAVTPLGLYWACLGHPLSSARCAVALCLVALGLWALGLRRAGAAAGPAADDAVPRAHQQDKGVPTDGLPDGGRSPVRAHGQSSSPDLRARVAVGALALLFALLAAVPWMSGGRQVGELISRSPCSGDWSAHRAMTHALLNDGIPARNPFVCHQPLTYYFGHFLEAAALVRLSGGALSVEAALLSLVLLLALASAVLRFHVARTLTGSDRVAAAATALTLFVGGLDLVVLKGAAWLGMPALWEQGHAQLWTWQPRIPFPYSNLHWSPHHHAAALLILSLLWLAVQSGQWGRRALPVAGVLLGGVLVNSVYLGLVACGALGLLMVGALRKKRSAALGALAAVAALGLVLASGVLWMVAHMVSNERRALTPALPYLSLVGQLLGLHGLMPGPAALQALGTAGGILGVVLQLGLVGALGVAGLRAARGRVPAAWRAGLISAAACAFLVRNFDLQIRASALLWMLLGISASWALGNLRRPATQRAWAAWSAAGVAAAVGVGSVTYEVQGMARPVYFDAHDVRVMEWVATHTPARAVVQAFPMTQPKVAWLPRPRYFVWPSFVEFTGRAAVMGDVSHVGMYLLESDRAALALRLRQAFEAPTPQEARRRFRAEGVEYILWTSGDEDSAHQWVRRNLLDRGQFALVFHDGPAFVVQVRP